MAGSGDRNKPKRAIAITEIRIHANKPMNLFIIHKSVIYLT